MFKKVIKANNETNEVNIINLFDFTLGNNISKWGELHSGSSQLYFLKIGVSFLQMISYHQE